MKKLLTLVLAIMMALSCISFASADEKTVITFWNGFTGPDGDVLKAIVNEFNETNTKNIFVEMDIQAGGPLYEKLPLAISTGNACDLIFGSANLCKSYVPENLLRPLDDFWAYEGVNKDDYVVSAYEGTIIEGKLYGIPSQLVVYPLFWNKDLFAAAGLDPETPPATVDQLIEYALKLTVPEKNQFGISFPSNDMMLFYHLLEANGGDVLNADKTASAINSEAGVKTLEQVQKLAEANAFPKSLTGGESDSQVLSGNIAMLCNGPWMVSGLKTNEINFGLTIFPAGDADPAPIAAPSQFCVTTCASDEKMPAIYEFIHFFNSGERATKWSLEAGYPPYLKSTAAESAVQDDYVMKQMSAIVEKSVASWKDGLTVADRIDSDAIQPMVEAIANGGDIATELATCEMAINDILAEAN